MRRVILQAFVSLDGLAAGEDGSVAFIPTSTQGDQSFGREQLALMDAIDAILLGGVTYRMFAGFWPNVTEGDEKPFADKVNATPKVVFSKTLERWGTWDEARNRQGQRGGRGREAERAARQGHAHLGQHLAGAIADGAEADRRVSMCPVVLGSRRPLFGEELASIPMHLVNAKRLDRGAVSLTYVPRPV